MSANLTEINMIRASQHGDLEAFNALILHFQDFFFRVALRILRDENLACDAVQEACLLLFKKISSFRDGSFRGWSARIVSNVCYDELRRQGRHPTQALEVFGQDGEEISSPYWLADVSTNPETQFEISEWEGIIHNCLETLSSQHQMILTLIDIEEFSYEEAASVLQVPLGTVKSRLTRARIELSKKLLASNYWLPGIPKPNAAIREMM